jgi:hypothetical protein
MERELREQDGWHITPSPKRAVTVPLPLPHHPFTLLWVLHSRGTIEYLLKNGSAQYPTP